MNHNRFKRFKDSSDRHLAEKTLGLTKPKSTILFRDAVTQFIAAQTLKNRPSTVTDYRQRLARNWQPLFNDYQLSEITRADVAGELQKLKDRPSEAQHSLVVLKVLFSWAISTGATEIDPTFRMASVTRYRPRERVLSEDEVKYLLKATEGATVIFERIVRLLILTGMRRNEAARTQWSWIDKKNKTITIPSEVAKNHRAATLPYSDLTTSLLAGIPEDGDYLFPAIREHVKGKPTSHFNGFSSKPRFDKKYPMEPWTPHDLRRTYSTIHASLGTPIHVTERLLNHISGTVSGVAATYNRHSYLPEMREAIARYETHLAKLLETA